MIQVEGRRLDRTDHPVGEFRLTRQAVDVAANLALRMLDYTIY